MKWLVWLWDSLLPETQSAFIAGWWIIAICYVWRS